MMRKVSVILATAVVAGKKDNKCHALAMSGGANNGAWEIGVMWGLAHYGEPEDYEWDVVSGVSAGSINAMYMSVWAPEDVVKMTEALSDVMARTLTHETWKNWKLGPLWGFWMKAGLLDDEPMFSYFQYLLEDFDSFKRRFTIGTVDIASGEYVTFDQTNILKEDLANASKSSSSIPIAFAPNHF